MKNLESFPAQERNEQQLVTVNNDRVVTTSLMVAEYFDKEHSKVLRAINQLDCSTKFRQANFGLSYYAKKNGNVSKSYPMYYLTRDGFTFLAMGFTGKVAAKFKEAYINAFNEMEEMLQKGEHAKYAEKMLMSEVKRFNKRMKEVITSIRHREGAEYGTYGDIQAFISICDGLPFEKNLHNVCI